MLNRFFNFHVVDAAFLLYAERSRIQYFDLTNNNHSTAVKGLKAAVAVAYDIRDAYIYWADMREHKIMRGKFSSTGELLEFLYEKSVCKYYTKTLDVSNRLRNSEECNRIPALAVSSHKIKL